MKYKHQLPHPASEESADALRRRQLDQDNVTKPPQIKDAWPFVVIALKACRDAIAGSLQPHCRITRQEIENILADADSALTLAVKAQSPC